jgi:hypothetical protein
MQDHQEPGKLLHIELGVDDRDDYIVYRSLLGRNMVHVVDMCRHGSPRPPCSQSQRKKLTTLAVSSVDRRRWTGFVLGLELHTEREPFY